MSAPGEEIKGRLANAVALTVRRRGLALGLDARDYLDGLLETAAQRMMDEARVSERDVVEAERAVIKLLREDFTRSKRAPGQPGHSEGTASPTIRRVDLIETLRRLCPIWPVC